MAKSEKSEWLEPRSLHTTYGNFYYFKSLNISNSENPQVLNNYRKYVVFLKNYADFLENSAMRSEDKLAEPSGHTQLDEPEPEPEPLVDDIELSEGSDPNKEDDLYKTEYIPNEESDIETSEYIPGDDSEDSSIANEIHNNLPFISLIMFSEKGEPMYCVKTESLFAEL
jgi:hypothetical protein